MFGQSYLSLSFPIALILLHLGFNQNKKQRHEINYCSIISRSNNSRLVTAFLYRLALVTTCTLKWFPCFDIHHVYQSFYTNTPQDKERILTAILVWPRLYSPVIAPIFSDPHPPQIRILELLFPSHLEEGLRHRNNIVSASESAWQLSRHALISNL